MSDQLPLYECHKRVRAAKILAIGDLTDGRAGLRLELEGGTFRVVGYAWMLKHNLTPANKVSGYFVEYADGYTSWSPTKAFEEGYQLLRENA